MSATSFAGFPLRGNKLVRIVYLDEAEISNPKQEPFLIVSGIAVNADRQFKAVEAYIDGLAEKHVPNRNKGHFAFHAMELFHGTKRFKREDWPLSKRLEILDDLAAIPAKFDLPICWGGTDRMGVAPLLSQPTTPLLLEQISHAQAVFKFVIQIEVVMRATANQEVAMLIAEDRPIMRRLLKVAHAAFRGRAPAYFQQEWEAAMEEDKLFKFAFPLERIVETVHFAEKSESSLLQVADICAFAIKRAMVKAAHWERLYEPLRNQVLFTPDVLKALSSSVQPS